MPLYDQLRRRLGSPTMPGEVTATESADPATVDHLLATASTMAAGRVTPPRR